MSRRDYPESTRPRLLIEEWLPIAEIGVESVRERTPMTPFPAPNRLHVWWARRPLVASRAAILASLLPADADRGKFLHMLGIHGDPVASSRRIDEAKRSGKGFEGPKPTATSERSATHRVLRNVTGSKEKRKSSGMTSDLTCPGPDGRWREYAALKLSVVDYIPSPTTSIPSPGSFSRRQSSSLPSTDNALLRRYQQLASEFIRRRDERLDRLLPSRATSEQHRRRTGSGPAPSPVPTAGAWSLCLPIGGSTARGQESAWSRTRTTRSTGIARSRSSIRPRNTAPARSSKGTASAPIPIAAV